MKNFIRAISSLLVLILLSGCFLLCSCNNRYDSANYVYFNCPIYIQVQGKKLTDNIKNQIVQELSAIEKQFDRNAQQSFVYQFNNAPLNQQFALSDYAVDILAFSKNCYTLSSGRFNPSIYPLLKVWQFAPDYPKTDFVLPSQTEIQNALDKVIDVNQLDFDKENKTLTKNIECTLDFGGIVKGYAVEVCGKILKQAGYEKGYISIGGSSIYILHSQTLSLRHPLIEKKGSNILDIDLSDMHNYSLSTSGDYEKYYIENEVMYSHLINANTGYPTTTGVRSVSLINARGAYSDGLSTACCLFEHSPNDIQNSPLIGFLKDIVLQKSQLVFVVYSKNGINQIITNAKKGEQFTLLDTSFEVVNI